MATYITLWRYTPQGIANIKESPARLDAAKEATRAMGGELKAFYLTMGAADLVTISEAPDDETAARINLAIAAQGNVSSQTMRAFTEAEFRELIASLP